MSGILFKGPLLQGPALYDGLGFRASGLHCAGLIYPKHNTWTSGLVRLPGLDACRTYGLRSSPLLVMSHRLT